MKYFKIHNHNVLLVALVMTFYHCSCSFVKYIAEKVGLDPLLTAIASYPNEIATLEKEVGMPMSALKKNWLSKISNQ